jgi:hypothetical protein
MRHIYIVKGNGKEVDFSIKGHNFMGVSEYVNDDGNISYTLWVEGDFTEEGVYNALYALLLDLHDGIGYEGIVNVLNRLKEGY